MAHYHKSLEAPGSIKDIFDYLSNFSNVAEWDPGVKKADKLTTGPIGPESEFRVVASFLGREVPLSYTLIQYEPHERLVFEAENDELHSRDEIRLRETRRGTHLTYDAKLTLKGRRSIADPLFQPVFRWIANDAWRGLKKQLSAY